jgi:hypothetical protein
MENIIFMVGMIKMITVTMLLSGFGSSVIRMSLKQKEIGKKRAILILKPEMEVSSEYIYVGYPGDCAMAISRCAAPVTFFRPGIVRSWPESTAKP